MKNSDFLMDSNNVEKFFREKGYNCLNPHSVVNNKDTVFITAGIQSILSDYREKRIEKTEKIYIAQPVIRTQFANNTSEGCGIAFVNLTTAGINITKQEYKCQIYDFLKMFYKLGMDIKKIKISNKDYKREWGDLLVEGKKSFYYYNNIEIGDTTYFYNVTTKGGEKIGIASMSDVGFGLERVRWCLTNNSYFDLYSNSENISTDVKALLSSLALMEVNCIKPSNKNVGYRARMFSKKMTNILEGRNLSKYEKDYLEQCIKYWKNWQKNKDDISNENILKEYTRNCNRYVLDILIKKGYSNISGININISKKEFENRIISAGVPRNEVKSFFIEDKDLKKDFLER